MCIGSGGKPGKYGGVLEGAERWSVDVVHDEIYGSCFCVIVRVPVQKISVTVLQNRQGDISHCVECRNNLLAVKSRCGAVEYEDMDWTTVVKILGEGVEKSSFRACAIQNDVKSLLELAYVLAERRLTRECAGMLRYVCWPGQVCADRAGILLGRKWVGECRERICRCPGWF